MTRKALIASFCDLNADLLDQAGGLDQDQGLAAMDAVNERYGKRGCARVRTLRAALRVCAYRDGRAWLLDLATLNETGPAQSVGGFRAIVDDAAPDWARDAEVSAVGEIRDELQAMRDTIAKLDSERAWQSLIYALDRAGVRRERLVS